MRTKLAIINDSVAAYSDPAKRAISGDGPGSDLLNPDLQPACHYLYEARGNMWAVGSCMIDPDSDRGGCVGGLAVYCSIDHHLKEEYRGHSVDFWDDLQRLHDKNKHWSPDGLTKAGHSYVLELINKYVS